MSAETVDPACRSSLDAASLPYFWYTERMSLSVEDKIVETDNVWRGEDEEEVFECLGKPKALRLC